MPGNGPNDVNQEPVNQAPVNQAPVNQAPVNQAPADQTSARRMQEKFDALATQIANASRRYAEGAGRRQHTRVGARYYSQMPEDVADIVKKAAYAGFLYDADGDQVWNFRPDHAPENPRHMWYLHFGYTTYRVFADPQYNIVWDPDAGKDNNRLVPIGSLNQLLDTPWFAGRFNVPPPAFQRAAPPEPESMDEALARYDTREKPRISSFWEVVDNLLMAITGGKFGIPSMNAYRRQRQNFSVLAEQARGRAVATYNSWLEAAGQLDALPQIEEPPQERPDPQQVEHDRRRTRADHLYLRMRSLSGEHSPLSHEDKQTVSQINGYFLNKIRDFDDNAIQGAEFDNVCNLFADYFGRNAKPEDRTTLLNALRGLRPDDIDRYFDNTLAQIQQRGARQNGMQQPGAQQLTGSRQPEVSEGQANSNNVQVKTW